MTNGTTQGLFIVLAIVIFGIFVLISYMLYQDKMKTGLTAIMCDAITITSKNTGFELPYKDCTATFPNEEGNEGSDNSEIPTGLQYYKIRDSNTERNESEVWVLIEHEQDNPNNVRIIDSGDRDGFTQETFGQDLDGIISFPDKIEQCNITTIDKKSFEQAKFSEIMKLPDELIILDDYSLQQSHFSGEARFPENLEIIGIEALRDSMFSGGLDTLENVREIREDAFKESEFTDSDLSNLGKNSEELVLAEGSLGKYRPEGTFKLPSNITSIGGGSGTSSSGGLGSGSNGSGSGSGGSSSGAFNSSGITSIDFSGVTDLKVIGDNAFKDAKITGTLKIPKTVQAIGKEAFKESNITKLDLTEVVNLEEIGDGAFENSRLTGILFLPDSVKRVGDRAFLKSVFINRNWKLPKNIEYIGDSSFQHSKMSGSFLASDSNNFKYIGDSAFKNSYIGEIYKDFIYSGGNTKNYTVKYYIELPDSIEYIGSDAFSSARFTGDFILPSNIKYIGDFAFSKSFGEYKIKRLEFPLGSGYSDSRFFYEEQSKFRFNEKIEYIGTGAFEQAHFNNISDDYSIVPYNLTKIGARAFRYSFGVSSRFITHRTGSILYYSRENSSDFNIQTIKVSRSLINHDLINIEIVD